MLLSELSVDNAACPVAAPLYSERSEIVSGAKAVPLKEGDAADGEHGGGRSFARMPSSTAHEPAVEA